MFTMEPWCLGSKAQPGVVDASRLWSHILKPRMFPGVVESHLEPWRVTSSFEGLPGALELCPLSLAGSPRSHGLLNVDAYPGTLESYSSVKGVYGVLEEPSGSLLAHPGASEVPAGALKAHTNINKADSGVCRHIYCCNEPPTLQGQPPCLQGEPS
jgi:hypothetical protein